MKIVKENINFERGNDPKKSMDTGGLANILKDKGVRFWRWDKPEENERIEENIQVIYEYVELVHNRGVAYENIVVGGYDHLEVKGFKVKDTNVVMANCLTEKDAQELIKTCIKTVPTRFPRQFHYENDESIYLHFSEHLKKWLKGEVD